jgi:hypothetical protein
VVLIRRATKNLRDYTVIMLKGEEPKWILTTNYEHNRILEIFKQDKAYEGIENDFTDKDWQSLMKIPTYGFLKDKEDKL